MGSRRKDHAGEVFDWLTVLEFSGMSPSGFEKWLTRCQCGKEKVIIYNNIRSGRTRSCGCRQFLYPSRYKHKLSGTKVHRAWALAKSRCHDPNNQSFHNYGGRGISMCREWRDSFELFLAEVGQPPTPKHTLDRIDNEGNYEPGNVRWMTRKAQCHNKRTNLWVRYRGEFVLVCELAERTGVPRRTLTYRLSKGWDLEEALTTPVVPRGPYKKKAV